MTGMPNATHLILLGGQVVLAFLLLLVLRALKGHNVSGRFDIWFNGKDGKKE